MNIMFLLTNRNVGLSVYTWWSWYTWDGIVDNVVLTVYHLKFTNFQKSDQIQMPIVCLHVEWILTTDVFVKPLSFMTKCQMHINDVIIAHRSINLSLIEM